MPTDAFRLGSNAPIPPPEERTCSSLLTRAKQVRRARSKYTVQIEGRILLSAQQAKRACF